MHEIEWETGWRDLGYGRHQYSFSKRRAIFSPPRLDSLIQLKDSRRANLRKADLQTLQRSGIDFRFALLDSLNLSNASITKSDLSSASIVGGILYSIDFDETQLYKVNFTGSNLQNAQVSGTNLSRANLTNANLSKSHMVNIKFTDAILKDVNLSKSSLTWIDFSNSDLSAVNMGNTTQEKTNFTGVHLWRADLSGTYLYDANMSNALLAGSNLSDLVYELDNFPGADSIEANNPKLESGSYCNPNISSISLVSSLDKLRYKTNPGSLTQLRNRLREKGYRDAAIKVNASLRRSWLRNKADQGFWDKVHLYAETWLFDKWCGFGVYPFKALGMAGLFMLGFSLVYCVALIIPRPRRRGKKQVSGIYLISAGKRIQYRGSKRDPMMLRLRYNVRLHHEPRTQTAMAGFKKWIPAFAGMMKFGWIQDFAGKTRIFTGMTRPILRAYSTALFFSLMATFNIGFRDLNVGRWIRLLHPYDFDLKAIGWPRVVFGIQSIISVYLIALAILSYFANPFEFGG